MNGWVKVFSYTQPREAILDYDSWYLQRGDEWQPSQFVEGKKHGKGIIAHIEGIDDRDAAAGLIGSDIAVSRDTLPITEDDSYYWTDLEGLTVVHRDGTKLGSVAYLMETGANDVLVVQGETERLIPFVAGEVILDVDLDKGVISVDWEWD